MINTKDFIENIQSEGKNVLAIVRKNFLNLSQNQLSWKPSPKRWSVGECFLHLINVNDYYLKFYNEYSGKIVIKIIPNTFLLKILLLGNKYKVCKT